MPRIHQATARIVIYCPSKHRPQNFGMPLSRSVKHFTFLSSSSDGVVQPGNEAVEICSIYKPGKLILTSMLLYRNIDMCRIYRLCHPYIIVKTNLIECKFTEAKSF